MSRLRVRIELNRGGVGVPLEKLASVVQKTQTFFRMLGDDVHIDQSQGEWLGFDFDHESLNFTAEFVGPVTVEQVTEFHSAFDGTTPLRRDTIAQFARIADAIEGDEVIGFGLYLNESDDPAEWRCLSRRDALRITEEIQALMGAGEFGQESHLPAVAEVNSGARYMFGRRDRSQDAAKLAGSVREVEAVLSKRISRLEGEVADHSSYIQDLRSKSVEAEQSMGRLLSAVEGFCEQAAIRLETVGAPASSAAAAASAAPSLPAPQSSSASRVPTPSLSKAPTASLSKPPSPSISAAPVAAAQPPITSPATDAPRLAEPESRPWWRTPVAIAVVGGLAVILLVLLLWPSSPSEPKTEVSSASEPVRSGSAAVPVPAASEPNTASKTTAPAGATAGQPAPASPVSRAANQKPVAAAPQLPNPSAPAVLGKTRIELEASEPSWISIRGADGTQVARLIEPGTIQSVDVREPAILRAGNAGGLTIHANGKTLGPLGPHGAVRDVAFRDGEFKLVPIK